MPNVITFQNSSYNRLNLGNYIYDYAHWFFGEDFQTNALYWYVFTQVYEYLCMYIPVYVHLCSHLDYTYYAGVVSRFRKHVQIWNSSKAFQGICIFPRIRM